MANNLVKGLAVAGLGFLGYMYFAKPAQAEGGGFFGQDISSGGSEVGGTNPFDALGAVVQGFLGNNTTGEAPSMTKKEARSEESNINTQPYGAGDAKVVFSESGKVLPVGAGNNVYLAVKKPTVNETLTSPSKNKDIRYMGTDQTVREAMRTSLAPVGVKTAELGEGSKKAANVEKYSQPEKKRKGSKFYG